MSTLGEKLPSIFFSMHAYMLCLMTVGKREKNNKKTTKKKNKWKMPQLQRQKWSAWKKKTKIERDTELLSWWRWITAIYQCQHNEQTIEIA